MNPAVFSIKNSTFTIFASFLLFVAGILAYFQLGRLEDPEYTVKTALIITQFPGATAGQVEDLVTDKIERVIRQLGEVKRTRSISKQGVSFIYVDIKDEFRSGELSQIWDKLRKKLRDLQTSLPEGVGTPVVRDDFGDVYGILLAVTGDGYSYAELKRYVDQVQKELSLLPDVSRVEIWGEQTEAIYMEIANSRLAEIGVIPASIVKSLQVQNQVLDAGAIEVGRERIKIFPSGAFGTVEEIGNLIVRGQSGSKLFFLKDIAKIERGYYMPPQMLMRFDSRPALGIAISIMPGGNVVRLGEAVKHRLQELMYDCPLGINLDVISYQPDTVTQSINDFVINLIEAVVIVVASLLVTMGLRSGLIIGFGLVLTTLVTLIIMQISGIYLQRVSLGALIIALGMLVDNAIVITELILVKIQRNMDRLEAARQAVVETAMPLLGATLIAVLAFLSIFLSKHSSGEYCASLFSVMAISLLASWVLALTVTPVTCYYFLKIPKDEQGTDPYRGAFYQVYKKLLEGILKFRFLTIGLMAFLLFVAIGGFTRVEKSFFPESTRLQFIVDYWLPEGSRIQNVSEDLLQLEQFLLGRRERGVVNVATFVGSGAPRFYLPMEPEIPNPCFGQVIVNVANLDALEEMIASTRGYLLEQFPYAEYRVKKFPLGVPSRFKVEVRFSGDDPQILKSLALQAENILRRHPETVCLRNDWRQRIKILVPAFSQPQANRAALSRYDMAVSLKRAYDGLPVGIYREGDKELPVLVRPPIHERIDVRNLDSLPVWGTITTHSVPLSQIVQETEVQWDSALICRRNRRRTITVQCDVLGIQASEMVNRIRAEIEAIPRPPGYRYEWGGEKESSGEAQYALFQTVPLGGLLMLVVLVALFNAIRQSIIIMLTVPLAMIGVTAGLLLTDQPFGFMALLGTLSLSGMVIKNSIVLIDKIDSDIREGIRPYDAIVASSVSRFRPILMTALTTVLGMIPLALDTGFYRPMAVAIMFGLTFATVLTLLVVPAFYSVLFKVK